MHLSNGGEKTREKIYYVHRFLKIAFVKKSRILPAAWYACYIFPFHRQLDVESHSEKALSFLNLKHFRECEYYILYSIIYFANRFQYLLPHILAPSFYFSIPLHEVMLSCVELKVKVLFFSPIFSVANFPRKI